MPKENTVYTEIDGQRIKLSNLDKILYPTVKVLKAEVIQYYMEVAPLMLEYIKDRPLTLIRFPDGIQAHSFYTKNVPDWVPEWIESYEVQHSKEKKKYLVVTDKASLTWTANLASLELHPMQWSTQQANPDHFIFDLDPESDQAFGKLKELAFILKDFLLDYGYTPFIKTSGSKGLHIYVPILNKWSSEEMVLSVKALAKEFVKKHPGICTLKMNKTKREGKTLLDIFRNHHSATTVAPFSLRGKPGAPVSMPIAWSDLDGLKSSKDFTLRNYKDYLEAYPNPWSQWKFKKAPLHDKTSDKNIPLSVTNADDFGLLKSYHAKRDFEKTNEPTAEVLLGNDDQFVIQMHNAQNLHYDLRLELNGVLKSWAIPKGLPCQKGIKRLAIQTEDHPIKYLDFEGVIPKGQYGAGEMWVFESGNINWIEKSEKKYKFELITKHWKRKFGMFRLKENEWLIETKEEKDFGGEAFIAPMLADTMKSIPTSKEYTYEIKWDGIRAIIVVKNDKISVFSRSGRDISTQFPELVEDENIKTCSGVFDGEIVCLDEKGAPQFSNVISRMHTTGKTTIANLKKSKPVVCYLYDCLRLNGKRLDNLPLEKRKAWLKVNIGRGGSYRYSEEMEDGKSLFEAAKAAGLEGVMAKRKKGTYTPGIRSTKWYKIKFRQTTEAIIIGYTKGQGDRAHLFGSLHLADYVDGALFYKGRIGTGFDMNKLRAVLHELEPLKVSKKPIKEKVDKERETTWLKPKLFCELEYASLSSNGTYREPVFLRMRPDLYLL